MGTHACVLCFFSSAVAGWILCDLGIFNYYVLSVCVGGLRYHNYLPKFKGKSLIWYLNLVVYCNVNQYCANYSCAIIPRMNPSILMRWLLFQLRTWNKTSLPVILILMSLILEKTWMNMKRQRWKYWRNMHISSLNSNI